MKKSVVYGIVVGIIVITVILCGLVLATTDNGNPSTSPNGSTTTTNGGNPEVSEQVLVDNEYMKVTFIEIFEESSVQGTGYLRLKVENKTDKTVTVYPKDVYVNDTSTILGSGVSMKLAPGKNSQAPFIIFYGNLGITSKDEIEKIEFKLSFEDENYDLVTETESLVIE